MIRFPILALLFATCVPGFDITRSVSDAPDLVSFLRGPRSCFTPCGMRATEGDCESLQRYEGRVLARIAPVGGWDAGTICEDLAGYEIKIHRHDPVTDRECSAVAWIIDDPNVDGCDGGTCCISGLTSNAEKTITVATTTWDRSALAHEIVHVADNVRPGHCPWLPSLQLALYELSHRVDVSAPEAECSR